ncbi:bifunctional metallophosphatase/5'-nucleotidase [Halobacteriales archaeon SW_6_65_15]|nr:MAG: bifunctional metallophosphatase/5'-nucleotidase [Halobacteriales archaeon SW_6_65_15]
MAPDNHDADERCTDRLQIDRRHFLGASAAASLAGLQGVSAAQTDAVTLVHDTHFHGRFEGSSGVNIAQYTHEVNRLRDEHANAGFVGIGDDFSPSTMGFEFHGEHVVEALNYLDPVVDGVGNHEFDFGIENAIERFENSEFPWVVANLLSPDDEPIPGTERWTVEQIGDYDVGFFGSGVRDFHGITAYPEDHQALHPVEAAKEAVAALESEADLVVMASHTNSYMHDEIASEVDGLDAIVGSHSNVVFDDVREVNGTLISEAGDEFGHLGVLQLDPATGDLVGWERVDLGSRSEAIPEDDGMRSIMDKWLGRLDDRLGETVFRTTTELDARFSTNYAVESNVGGLICDVMREEMDAEIGLQNPGGIRSADTYGPGAITGKDVYNVLPFPNKVVKGEVTGEALKETLETSVSALPWSSYGVQAGAQVSGIQYEFTGTGESAVGNFYVNGEPLREDETYTIATNDYVFDNWDGLSDGTLLEVSKDFLGTVFIDHLREAGVVEPEVDNRILRVDENAGLADVERSDDAVTVVFDRPEKAERVYGKTFRAVTEFGHEIAAESVEDRGDRVAVTFDYEDLSALATGPKDPDLRVFGGFEPDDEAYDYRYDANGDGEYNPLYDLPVAEPAYYFTVKATVPTNGRGPNPFGGDDEAGGPDFSGSGSEEEEDGGRREPQGSGHGHGRDHGGHGHDHGH